MPEEKHHIVFIFPKFKLLSGAERLILKLASALLKKGERVTILCHYFHPSCLPELPPGVPLLHSEKRLEYFKNRYINAAFDYLLSLKLRRRLPLDADCYTFFGPALPLLWFLKKIKRVKKPCFYFCYEPPRFIYRDRKEIVNRMGIAGRIASPFFGIYRLLDKMFLASADRVLANSEFGKEEIERIYKQEATVITHGVDEEGFSKIKERGEIKKRHAIPQEAKVIITANYLHPRKRVHLLIKAMPYILKEIPEARALIVGDGPERGSLEKLASTLGVGKKVIFAGFIPDPELPSYYRAGDIYLHPGKLESFGLSIIEAAYSYLPVVSVAEGGPCYTVQDGETGFLVPADPEAMAEKAVYLLKNRDKAGKMGEAGHRFIVENFSWDKGAEDFLSVLTAFSKET
jgi:glycosyltransferase involved in cell wall biosynthesis